MKILMVGTTHEDGSFTAHLDKLSSGLESLGASVRRIGLADAPLERNGTNFWPADRIETAARELVAQVTLTNYDVIALHYGNFEVEQLLPEIWKDIPHPPVVNHAHHVDWSLFKENVPDERRYRQVLDGVARSDGHVHYCTFSKDAYAANAFGNAPSIVSFYPAETVAGDILPTLDEALGIKIEWSDPDAPLVSMCGFVNPWKNVRSLVDALTFVEVPLRVLVVGPGWDDVERIGVDLADAIGSTPRNEGKTEIAVVPSFVDIEQRTAIIKASAAGVFPYTNHATFQGSGAVTAYLAAGVPVVATDVGSFTELVADAGRIVRADDPEHLAAGLNAVFASPEAAATMKRAAVERAALFTPELHASQCFELYKQVAGRE